MDERSFARLPISMRQQSGRLDPAVVGRQKLVLKECNIAILEGGETCGSHRDGLAQCLRELLKNPNNARSHHALLGQCQHPTLQHTCKIIMAT